MTDRMLINQLNANRQAEIAALRAEHEATLAAIDRRFNRALARVARYAAIVPAALGALNVAGLI